MNLIELLSNIAGLLFVLLFFGLVVIFIAIERRQIIGNFREIAAFQRLKRIVGLTVEAGTRLHITLGSHQLLGLAGASGLAGLNILERIVRAAHVSDRPPVATSGEGVLAILSQDVLQAGHRASNIETPFDATAGRVSGLTPFSYAAGTLPVIHDEGVSANILAGHFGPEAALITEAADRGNNQTVAGTDHIPTQAVLFAVAQEPLMGEEFYAGGAYLGSGPVHLASLRTQDVFRWLLILIILGGAFARLVGLL